MALQSSGAISLSDLATEFPDTTPYSLSEFYRGGGKVPDAASNSAVPTSGAISLGNFYNAVNRVAINITLSANQTNYVLNTAKASGYVAGISDITLTIDSGVYVSSNTTGGYALDVDTSWAAGDTVTIVNNGFIVGMGGVGGNGPGYNSTNGSPIAGSAGSGGGPALIAQRSVTVQNNGTIGGGGGGGGGGQGAQAYVVDGKLYIYIYAAGGGGGGGRSGSTNASGGGGQTSYAYSGTPISSSVGGTGTASSPGAEGTRGSSTWSGRTIWGGNGGAGGDWGAGGGSGAGWTRSGGDVGVLGTTGAYGGGSAGIAVAGNGNITWTATGIRLGAIT